MTASRAMMFACVLAMAAARPADAATITIDATRDGDAIDIRAPWPEVWLDPQAAMC